MSGKGNGSGATLPTAGDPDVYPTEGGTAAHASTRELAPAAPRSGWSAWKRPRVALVSAAVLLVVLAVVAASAAGLLPWRDYVERRPPDYLALSFVNPSALPNEATVGRPLTFAFDVTNPAPHQRTVHWTTTVRDVGTGASRDAGGNDLVVPAKGQVRTTQQVVLDQPGRQQVTVTTGPGETIAFYVTASGSPTANGT